jgi:T-complex protein 1 subunit alpha
MLTEN